MIVLARIPLLKTSLAVVGFEAQLQFANDTAKQLAQGCLFISVAALVLPLYAVGA